MRTTRDNLLFIVPPNMSFDDFVNPPENVKTSRKVSGVYGAVTTDIPLGVISLSAYVKNHTKSHLLLDFNVLLNKTEDFNYPSFKEFFHQTIFERKEFSPTIICISCLFVSSYQNLLAIGECCRELFPEALIVAGGGVPTNMYEQIFRESDTFDALCNGEGEKALLGLVLSFDRKQYLVSSPSWITKGKRTELKQDNVSNLDDIPFYDYEMLDIEGYDIYPTISSYSSTNSAERSVGVMTSRGCPHKCCFCSSHSVHGRKMRYHSTTRVRSDLAYLKSLFGAKVIAFQDDHLMANKSRVYEIIAAMRELQLTAFFPNSLALYALDRKMLEALKSIGVNQLVLSIESGSNRVLRDIMHKSLNLDIVNRVAQDCSDLSIYTDANLLVGLPGETQEDISDARSFLKTIDVNWFRINVATPLVGSELYQICMEKKYLGDDFLKSNFKKAVIETEDFSAEDIQQVAYTMNLELNFVHNSDVRRGNYKTALNGFENTIRAKGDHAIAFFYASLCYEKLGNPEKASFYLERAKMFAQTPFWKKYVEMFNVPLLQ